MSETDEVGTLVHFARHRDEYLTRAQAAARVRKSDRTIRNYLAAGLPVHVVLGTGYIHLEQLQAMLKANHSRRKATRYSQH